MKDIVHKDLYMVYVNCSICKIWTPVWSMLINSLHFNCINTMATGICILCDKNTSRDKFTNINQSKTNE